MGSITNTSGERREPIGRISGRDTHAQAVPPEHDEARHDERQICHFAEGRVLAKCGIREGGGRDGDEAERDDGAMERWRERDPPDDHKGIGRTGEDDKGQCTTPAVLANRKRSPA